jgi:GT2 family glycosyltransferase
VFLNPDTIARPGAVRALARTLEDERIGIAQARLLLKATPELLNSAGNVLHPSGLAWPGGYGEPAAAVDASRDIAYASGAACGIRTSVFRELGGFTERLFLYQEDLDLSWRAWLSGLRVVVDPHADVVHDYVVERFERRKQYYLERNRLVCVTTLYGARTLVLLAPLLLVVELAVTALALREGWFREKARGWFWLAANASWLRARRRRIQAERRVSDRALARLFSPSVRMPMLAEPPGIGLFNRFAEAWWRGVRVFL